jgi:hypothetical protein
MVIPVSHGHSREALLDSEAGQAGSAHDGVAGHRFAVAGNAKWIPAFARMTSMRD